MSTSPTGCPICGVGYRQEEQLTKHKETPGHRRNFLFWYYQRNKGDLLASPHKLGLELSIVAADQGVLMTSEQGVVEVVSKPDEVKVFKIQ